jgi:hypothetical protein
MRHSALFLVLLTLGCPGAADDDSANTGPYGPDFGGTPLVADPTWTTDIHPILTSYCSDCHTGGGFAPAWLDSYSAAATTRAAAPVCSGHVRGECFDVRIGDGSMPDGAPCEPGGAGCITVDEFATLQEWVRDGMPE